eukprot:CAMPEP_0194083356 /NCGR_PEP_ID=MMETSP0149-20130528/9065_1 /TAXON_ID=122233 /ORGANISM="Chaetoceros debilis, Strain MM31A-1" /LENGTH=38 /DNA_ID= /DNA_START= /DNA_END= /DNA_ORIENTATION=
MELSFAASLVLMMEPAMERCLDESLEPSLDESLEPSLA